jgi:hypothetical protein
MTLTTSQRSQRKFPSMTLHTETRLSWTAALSLVCGLLLFLPSLEADNKRPWTGVISGHPIASKEGLARFVLLTVTQDRFHLTGGCVYDNAITGGRGSPTVTIEGTESEGTFWPDVICQVTNDAEGKWETIATISHGHSQAIAVAPGEAKFNLTVGLDIFQPLIDKYRLGRVVLKTGEAATFELKDLLPPNSPH